MESLQEMEVAAGERNALGLYLHVPFCSTTCDFCAFYQERPERGDFDRFVEGVERELELLELPLPVTTVFWGGGTPGLLPPEQILRVGELLNRATDGRIREWSVELTPGCVRDARLEALAEIGVTRLSLGAQSFQPRLLESLGRMHPREKIFSAFEKIREHRFRNVNLDLMFALPNQTPEEWRLDLAEAFALGPEHISTYCLTFEEDTALYIKLSEGKVRRDEEVEVSFYRIAWEEMAKAGFGQYEISNYARPGFESLHNLNTWRMHEWIGLGPSGASQYRGVRSVNSPNLNLWLERLGSGIRSDENREELTPEVLASDYLIFGFRLNEGVDLGEFRERFRCRVPDQFFVAVDQWIREGLVVRSGESLRLTAEGRLVVDRIGMELLELFAADEVSAV